MFRLPSKGFQRSVTSHNVQLDSLCDWLEACITFSDDRISQIDVLDVLMEENLYSSQDFASERIRDAWYELRRRRACLGRAVGFSVEHRSLVNTAKWSERPAYAFCLMLSLQPLYRKCFTSISDSYVEQGALFERLTAESLNALGWEARITGWSRTRTSTLPVVVREIATHIDETPIQGGVGKWTSARAKDAGTDVVCVRRFPDRLGGRPVYLVQCASGEHWDSKLHPPIMKTWEKLIDFSTSPRRGFSMPYVLLQDEFRKTCAATDLLALLLDRHRLLAPAMDGNNKWLSNALGRDLARWTRPRVKVLPILN